MTFNQKLLTGLAAASLTAAPAMAEAPRASAPVGEASELGGDTDGGAWIAILGVIAVVVLAVIAASDGDDNPVSA